MIDSNLAVLLAERNLKITKVSKDTGISRTTLTSLCYDYTAGIKYSTLNILCQYLNITPTEFFSFIPYDYVVMPAEEQKNTDFMIKERGCICAYDTVLTIRKNERIWEYSFYSGVIEAVPANPFNPFSRENPYTNITMITVPKYELEDISEASSDELIAIHEFEKMKSVMTPRQKEIFKEHLAAALHTSLHCDLNKDDEGVFSDMPEMKVNVISSIFD